MEKLNFMQRLENYFNFDTKGKSKIVIVDYNMLLSKTGILNKLVSFL